MNKLFVDSKTKTKAETIMVELLNELRSDYGGDWHAVATPDGGWEVLTSQADGEPPVVFAHMGRDGVYKETGKLKLAFLPNMGPLWR